MRRSALAVAVLSAACATAHNYLDPAGPRFDARYAPPRDHATTLRIVTFNIENGRRIQEAIAGLKEHRQLRGADVLVLQEMTAAGVESIARALALNAVYFPASRLKGHDCGNAVLSPWPIEASWKVLLPYRTRIANNARAAVAARLRIDERLILVYSVHLGSPLGLSGRKRREQAEAVLADADRSPGDPVIVAGDFNSCSVEDVFVRGGFQWATQGVGNTIRMFCFDHIFVRGLPFEAGSAAGVAREVRNASDHWPVWALLPLHQERGPRARAYDSRGGVSPHVALPITRARAGSVMETE